LGARPLPGQPIGKGIEQGPHQGRGGINSAFGQRHIHEPIELLSSSEHGLGPRRMRIEGGVVEPLPPVKRLQRKHAIDDVGAAADTLAIAGTAAVGRAKGVAFGEHGRGDRRLAEHAVLGPGQQQPRQPRMGWELGQRAAQGRDPIAATRLARDRLDHHGAILDFSHFQFKQPAHELDAGARKNQLRAAVGRLDLQKQAAHPLAGGVILARNPLPGGQDGLRLAKVHHQVAALTAPHDPRHNVADVVLVVVVDPLLLKLPQPLHDGLPGGLGRDPPKFLRIHLLLDEQADLRVRAHLARLLNVDLGARIGNRVHHLENRPRLEVPVLRIDLNAQFLARVDPLHGGAADRVGDGRDHVVPGDPLFLLHVFENG